MKKLLFISTAIFGMTIAKGQTQITFEKSYSNNGYNRAYCVRQCDDKGYVMLGSFQYSWAYYTNMYLIKTDSLGNMKWSRTYSPSIGASIEKTFDHGYILLGNNYSVMTIIKIDSVGNIKWTKQFHNTVLSGSFFSGSTIVQTADSGYVIAGTFQVASGNQDVFLLKINSNGDSLWEKTYGDAGFDVVLDMKKTKANGFILAGKSQLGFNGNYLLNIIKVNSVGDSIWSYKYNQGDQAFSIYQTFDNGFITLGYNFGMLLMKIDSSGNVKWNKMLNGFQGGCVIETKDKGFYATGDNFYCAKTNSAGNLLWERKLGIGNYSTSGYSRNCIQTNDNGLATVGWYNWNSLENILLIKMDSNGCVRPSIQQIIGQHNVTVNTSISFTTTLNSGTDSLHFNWSTNHGQILNGQSTDSINVLWNQTGTDSLLLVIFNSCGTDTLYYPINIQQCVIPLADSIHGSYLVDPYTTSPNYYVNKIQGTDTITYTWSSAVVSIISGNGTNSVTVSALYNGIGTLTVICSNLCGKDTLTKSISVLLNGVHDIYDDQFSTSPNPFSTQTTLHAGIPLHNATLTVDNCFGQTVKQIKNIRGQTVTLSRDNLPSGLYFIRLMQEGKILATDKLIIAD
jgi:hypothetical protein